MAMTDSLSANYVRLCWSDGPCTAKVEISGDLPLPPDAYAILASLSESMNNHVRQLSDLVGKASDDDKT